MKTILIILDGVSDEPIAELGGRTPLEAAFAPNIHYIASRGQVGRIQTAFDGYPIESMVCIMGLLGYAPEKYYPAGRASFEALAKGIPLNPDDLVLRCNSVRIDAATQTLQDFTAGLITDSDARKLISQFQLPSSRWELYPGQSYRNILIIRGAGVDARQLKCFEPHMHIGRRVQEMLPTSANPQYQALMQELGAFLLDSQAQIAQMELPESCRANMLWVWSPSSKPVWPSFRELTGLNAAIVGGLDFLHGMAMAAKIHFDVIPGATGYIDTDYNAKAEYTLRYLEKYDFVLTHINAPDEEAHQHNYLGKVEAIEKADRFVVAPILNKLLKEYSDDFRIMICGDHMTRSRDGKHINTPVPYAVLGNEELKTNRNALTEAASELQAPEPSLRILRNKLWPKSS